MWYFDHPKIGFQFDCKRHYAGSERASPHLMVYNDIPGVGLPFKQHERTKSSSEHESCTCTY